MTTPRRFAADTAVPSSKSKMELDALLLKHGATQRGVYEEADRGIVIFSMQNRQIKLVVKLPALTGLDARALAKAEQDTRAAWRRVLLVTKAKLELVLDAGGNIEQEFLADILLPDGRTVHDALKPQLADSYENGKMPPLLGPGGG